jgi:hypothetical protein
MTTPFVRLAWISSRQVRGYTLFLQRSEAVFRLRERERRASVLRMKVVGANKSGSVTGLDVQPGKEQLLHWQRLVQVAHGYLAVCSRAVLRDFIRALIWCTTAINGSLNMISWSARAGILSAGWNNSSISAASFRMHRCFHWRGR